MTSRPQSGLAAMQETAPPPALGAVQTYSLVDQVVAQLTEEIITGKYLPGERLKEQAIAVRFGTSRAPLREAFRVLEREGLIEILPWRGVRVANPTPEEVRELFEVRADLFGLCARRFALTGKSADVRKVQLEISELIRATESGCDEKDYKARTNAISVLMSSMVDNRYLHAIMSSLRQKMLWYYCFLGTSTFERRRDSNASWQELSAALQSQDAPAAERAAHRVISAAGEFALQKLQTVAGEATHAAPVTRQFITSEGDTE